MRVKYATLQQWFLPGLLLLLLTACSTAVDEEKRLRQAMEQLVLALEQRDQTAVIKKLASDVRAQRGMRLAGLNRLMQLYFRQNTSIRIFVSGVHIKMMSRSADVSAKVLLTGSGGFLPERGRRYEVQMRWQKQNSEWKLARVKWKARA